MKAEGELQTLEKPLLDFIFYWAAKVAKMRQPSVANYGKIFSFILTLSGQVSLRITEERFSIPITFVVSRPSACRTPIRFPSIRLRARILSLKSGVDI